MTEATQFALSDFDDLLREDFGKSALELSHEWSESQFFDYSCTCWILSTQR